jgi:hypothetical protein
MAWNDTYDQQYAALQHQLAMAQSGGGMGVINLGNAVDIQRQMQAVVAARDAEAARQQAAGSNTGSSGVTGTVNPAVTPPPAAFSATQIMEDFFSAALGITGMGAWAADLQNRGASPTEIVRALRYGTDTSETGKAMRAKYLEAFPGMDEFLKDGTFPGENPELQYIAYRNTVKEAAARYGIPDATVSKEAIANYIRGKTSPAELSDRMSTAATAIATTPAETFRQLDEYYGVKNGDLMAFYLDTDKTEAELQKRYTAARIGTEAARSSFGIDRAFAEDLAQRGTSVDEAVIGFGKASQQRGFTAGRGDVVDQAGLINAQFGVASSAADVARVAAARKARFAGGDDFAGTDRGAVGIGSAAI